MRAVITVVGKDNVGILASVANECADFNINVTDVTQSVLRDMFVMVMLTDISDIRGELADFSLRLEKLGKARSLSIKVMHEDIFNAMHNI